MANMFDELNEIDDEYSLKDYSDEDLKKILKGIKKNRPDLLDDVDDVEELAAAMEKYLNDHVGPVSNSTPAKPEVAEVDKVESGDSLIDEKGELILDSDAANKYTFKGNTRLARVKVTNATAIRDNMFDGCTKLTDVIFAEDCPVEIIGMGAFRGCKMLKNIVIPNSVTSIGGRAFESCTNLRSIKLSDNITEIGYYLFENCGRLIEIVVPDKVTVIKPGAFQKCTSLRRVTLPEGVKLSNWPFSSLLLSDIIFKGTKQRWKAVAGKKNLPVDRVICTDGKIILNQGYGEPSDSDDVPAAHTAHTHNGYDKFWS